MQPVAVEHQRQRPSGTPSRRSIVSLAMTARRLGRKPEGEVGLRE